MPRKSHSRVSTARQIKKNEKWERRKCRAKKTYETVIDAAIGMAAAWMNNSQMQYVYECPWCSAYHLTSIKKAGE